MTTKTIDLEVHHHHTRERKTGKEILFEFFMLFLAVSLGFFVENQRERHVENVRAKDFAHTLYTELKRDTTTVAEIIRRTKMAYLSLDTLIDLLSGPPIPGKTGLLYYHCGLGMYNLFFTGHEATLQEMKSSGAIRYYKNYELVSAITDYEYSIRYLYQLETNSYFNFMETRKIQMKIFDNQYIYSSLILDSSYAGYMNFIAPLRTMSPRFISTDPGLLAEFRNWARNRAELDRMKVMRYQHLIVSARHLLGILRSEYHLE